jgi:hypothetical protein
MQQRWRRSLGMALCLWLSCASFAQSPPAPEFVYRAKAGDTLIGFAQRALVNPAQWRELQRRNRIVNPQRIPIGTAIRVPQDWLRQSVVTAEVLQTIGNAQLDGRPLTRGALLGEGAVVTTGADGFVTLRFADGGLVILQAGSRLLVQRLRRYDGIRQHDTQVRLETGRANSQLTPNPSVGRFEIATPVAVSAVRGTEFRTQFDAERTLAGAEVTDGTVAVAGTREVAVPAGFGTTTDASGTPAAPVRLLPAPVFVAAPEQWNRRELLVELQPVAGAVEYRAQLARDSALREVIAEGSAREPEVRFAAVADGEYWLRVNAVDERSLVGFDRVQRITVSLLPDPPVPAEPLADSKVSGEHAELTWQPSGDATNYRLQVARDVAFGTLEREANVAGDGRYRAEALQPGTYFWRVAAVRKDGAAGEWSAARGFELKALPLAPVVALQGKRDLAIAWAGTEGQTFRVQISRDPQFATSSADFTTQVASHTWPASGPGQYHIRVQATDADGYVGPWSPAGSIEAPPPRWIRWMPLATIVPFLLL